MKKYLVYAANGIATISYEHFDEGEPCAIGNPVIMDIVIANSPEEALEKAIPDWGATLWHNITVREVGPIIEGVGGHRVFGEYKEFPDGTFHVPAKDIGQDSYNLPNIFYDIGAIENYTMDAIKLTIDFAGFDGNAAEVMEVVWSREEATGYINATPKQERQIKELKLKRGLE